MDKEQKILTAATKLFAEEGVSVPTSRIAKAAGVSNGTLFNYFETKQALIDSLYYSVKAGLVETLFNEKNEEIVTEDFHSMLKSTWHFFVNWALENPYEFAVIGLLYNARLISDEVLESSDKLFEFFFNALEKGQENGDIYPAPIEMICELGQAQLRALVGYVQQLELQGAELTQAIDTAFDLHWRGISKTHA